MKFLILFLLSFSLQSHASLKLALNWKAEPQFGGFYAAEKHFKQNKLAVQVLEGGSGAPTIQMLAAGQVEYAIVSADEIIIAHSRGATDIVAVFAAYQTNPQCIMTHADRGFKQLSDVLQNEGRLLWQSGLPYAQFLSKKYSPVKVKTSPYTGGISAFQSDKQISQQGFITSEPLLAEKAGLKVKNFLVAESGFNPYTTVLVTQKSRLQKHPEEVKSVVSAVRAGWSDYLKNPDETNKAMGQINKSMDAQTFKASAVAQVDLIKTPESLALGSMTLDRWEELVQQLSDLKIIKKAPKATELFTNL